MEQVDAYNRNQKQLVAEDALSEWLGNVERDAQGNVLEAAQKEDGSLVGTGLSVLLSLCELDHFALDNVGSGFDLANHIQDEHLESELSQSLENDACYHLSLE